ncbi:AI-2E family transporter [Devosia rhodophyticola]|uniref:AI-2E family transporter n=1 Tax=Devosia rhodophyticola TaxID=3026423 RepID=A0ABY7YVR5_9HYPH|nr:AI-2E family transporter [Devosia rhodophyticola]WDR05287.1 AI-2E family transporter [Devosia rhodophyticola]
MIKPVRRPRALQLSQGVSDSQFERILGNAAKGAVVLMGLVVLLAALKTGQVILAPVSLAILIGLMFGPVADRMEAFGVPPALSAAAVVLMLIGILLGGIALFAVPLSDWVDRGPLIWEKLRTELANWKEPLQSVSAFQEQLSGIMGNSTSMAVTVEDGGPVTNIAFLAPAVGAQILVFLASFYFFVATRDHIRISVLSLCVSRRMRWRTAHIFQDIEHKVSRFLLSITFINFCVAVAVSLAMWGIGMPSPILWGAMAGVLNYIPYVGQGIMVIVLLAVGLGTQTGLAAILLPTACYIGINFVEGQIVTPHFIGRTMTLNPFIIFLSISFWIWAWGPVGGLIAVPSLLIATSILDHAIPRKPVMPKRPVRRTRNMSDRDELLANAATVIREKSDAEDAANAAAVDAKNKSRDTPESADSPKQHLPPEGTAPSGAQATS